MVLVERVNLVASLACEFAFVSTWFLSLLFVPLGLVFGDDLVCETHVKLEPSAQILERTSDASVILEIDLWAL